MAVWTSLVLTTALFTTSAFAADSDPLTIVNNLSDFIFSCIKAIGIIILGWGVVQLGMSVQSHDATQRTQGVLCLFGGLLIAFAKEILTAIGVVNLTVIRNLRTEGIKSCLQTYHVPDILWIENTGGDSMQIRASTALRNEYLQISQLAKVSGEPIYITNKGEADLVIQSIEAYEQREKMLAHRASVLEAELDRLSGAPTYSPEQVRGRMKEIFDAARVSD